MSKARQIAMPLWLFALVVILGGCTTERPNDLPGNATLGAEGNREVHFMAPSSGTAYVYDNNNEHLIWSGAVHKGDTIDVDPDNNRITVADKKVTTQTLARGRDHRVYFAPKSSTMSSDRDHDDMSTSSEHSTSSDRDRQ